MQRNDLYRRLLRFARNFSLLTVVVVQGLILLLYAWFAHNESSTKTPAGASSVAAVETNAPPDSPLPAGDASLESQMEEELHTKLAAAQQEPRPAGSGEPETRLTWTEMIAADIEEMKAMFADVEEGIRKVTREDFAAIVDLFRYSESECSGIPAQDLDRLA